MFVNRWHVYVIVFLVLSYYVEVCIYRTCDDNFNSDTATAQKPQNLMIEVYNILGYLPKGYHKSALESESFLADATARRIANGTTADNKIAGSPVATMS